MDDEFFKPEAYQERKLKPPVRFHKFKFSRRDMALIISKYVGSDAWEGTPYRLEDALALGAEFSRELCAMLDVFGRDSQKFNSGIDLTTCHRESKQRVRLGLKVMGHKVERVIALDRLRPLAELLVDAFEDVYGPNWRR